MSEQQSVTGEQATLTSACPHPEAVGKRWGDPISEERQRELNGYLQRWEQLGEDAQEKRLVEHRGPFAGLHLSGGDVFYLAACALANAPRPSGTWGNRSLAEEQLLRSSGPDKVVRQLLGLTDLHLESADLGGEHLEGAYLQMARLEGAWLGGAHLENAFLPAARLKGASLRGAHLERADLSAAHLEEARLEGALLEGASLREAHLERARLGAAHLETFDAARLEGADLREAHLEGARLDEAHLERANLNLAHLEGADLRRAWLDNNTVLAGATFDAKTRLGDIQWGGVGAVNLTRIVWERVPTLGDEQKVGLRSPANDHAAVVRAYRQLAAQLRVQGFTEVADRFALRAQVRQRWAYLSSLLHDWRRPWRWPGDLLRYLGSLFLAMIAGYGFRPGRTLLWYVVTILSFMGGYLMVTHGVSLFGLTEPADTHPLRWYEALVLSVASFHGRGFFPQGINLGDPVAILAASEAVIGLFIEISFIATFTQRYYAR